MHWLGEVSLHDEICKWIKMLLLGGTSCIGRWGHRIQVSLSRWSSFKPSSSLSIDWWKQKPERHLLLTYAVL